MAPQAPGPGIPGPAGATGTPAERFAGFGGPLAVVLAALGLSIPFDSSNAWSSQISWAIFAQLAALAAGAPALLRSSGQSPRSSWFVGAVGTSGLLGYWLLVVLPSVGSNEGFVLTLATALAACGSWFSPHRPR
ncbi:apolipoprotein N-acyltransferase [Nakamurella sp. UYEF19]|uniref:hypothetical protein n=1 Tax=Nakamurella sp. UYEF19 TaxID=1756392 RepID=UPI0033932BBA